MKKNKNRHLKPLLISVLIINFLLFLTKLYIGISTNCICIFTDSLNNLVDSLSGLFAFIGVALMSLKPTKKHPFGFGRLEYIVGTLMALIMTVAGVTFLISSTERFFMPMPISYFRGYAFIIFITLLVKVLLGVAFLIFYKKDNSPILKSIYLDSFLDSGITAVALTSFTLSQKVGVVIDAFLGLFISIVIVIMGIRLTISSFSLILGKGHEYKEDIENMVFKIEPQCKIKSILIHDYGKNYKIAEIHLEKTFEFDTYEVQNKIKKQLMEEWGFSSAVEWE